MGPLDVDICQRFQSSLVGHLLENDDEFNMDKMDYSVFCKGMKKVQKEQTEELAAFKKEKVAYNKKLKAAEGILGSATLKQKATKKDEKKDAKKEEKKDA